MKALFTFLLVASCSIFSFSQCPNNIVSNGNFEGGTDPMSGNPSFYFTFQGSTINLTTDTPDGSANAASLCRADCENLMCLIIKGQEPEEQ